MATAKDRSQQKLVKVYSAENEMEARMMQELLASAGIESVINAELAGGLFPLNIGGLAKQDILVCESDAEESSRIISELPENAGDPAE